LIKRRAGAKVVGGVGTWSAVPVIVTGIQGAGKNDLRVGCSDGLYGNVLVPFLCSNFEDCFVDSKLVTS
jgi:hypothetical protein